MQYTPYPYVRPAYDPRDLAFLRQQGINPSLVMVSFFEHPHDWRCPVCSAPKHSLLRRREKGRYFSNIEEHHFGPTLPCGDEVRYLSENDKVAICGPCNQTERKFRLAMKKAGTPIPLMTIVAMRSSPEFLAMRAKFALRDTYKGS